MLIVNELNNALRHELESIHRYFMFHRVLEHKGYNKLAPILKLFSIQEMRHADGLMGRILFLGGTLEVSMPKSIKCTFDIEEMMRTSKEDETETMEIYNRMITDFEDQLDHESAKLINDYLTQEQEHAEWFRKQLDIIDTTGLGNYLAVHIGNGEDPDGN